MKIPRDLKGIKGMRIAWSMDLGYFEVAENIQRETRRTLEILANAGAEVVEVDASWAAEAVEAAHAWGGHIYADDFVNAVRDHPDAVTDYTPYFAEANDKLTAAQFHRSMTVAGRVWWDHFGPLFKQFDAFICPTVSTVEVAADMKPWDDSLRVNGKPVGASDWAMTGLFNMYGRCPVLAVPSGSTPGGSPTGIQIVARPYDDVTAFRIARALEQRQPWMDDPARRPAL
jgi:Asp-tRNA(Asn)/Glu-tRNA(Gln) amidotransferase A subunit family amidase